MFHNCVVNDYFLFKYKSADILYKQQDKGGANELTITMHAVVSHIFLFSLNLHLQPHVEHVQDNHDCKEQNHMEIHSH